MQPQLQLHKYKRMIGSIYVWINNLNFSLSSLLSFLPPLWITSITAQSFFFVKLSSSINEVHSIALTWYVTYVLLDTNYTMQVLPPPLWRQCVIYPTSSTNFICPSLINEKKSIMSLSLHPDISNFHEPFRYSDNCFH